MDRKNWRHVIGSLSLIFVSGAAYSQDGYSDGLLCSSIYFIASGAFSENPQAAEGFMNLQKIYEATFVSQQAERLTNGQIKRFKHDHLVYLGDLYDENPEKIYELEMQCNQWREIMLPIILPALSKIENSDQLEALMRTVPSMSKRTFDSSDSRWSNSKKIMDLGFKFWSDNGRLTPFAVGEEVREELRGGNKQ